MKKILLLLVLLFAFIGCKQNPKQESVTVADSTVIDTLSKVRSVKAKAFIATAADTCDYYLPIQSQTTANQLAWLRNNRSQICGNNEYLKCLVRYHQLTETAFDSAVIAYWGTATPVYTSLPYSSFKGQDCDFVNYYVFTADSKTHAISKMFKSFSTNAHNYSVPFFKGLPLVFTSVVNTTNLKFTQGRIGNVEMIIFKIDGVADAYFDYSKMPSGAIN